MVLLKQASEQREVSRASSHTDRHAGNTLKPLFTQIKESEHTFDLSSRPITVFKQTVDS